MAVPKTSLIKSKSSKIRDVYKHVVDLKMFYFNYQNSLNFLACTRVDKRSRYAKLHESFFFSINEFALRFFLNDLWLISTIIFLFVLSAI